MPYAAENRISQEPFEGCIEITEEQYTAGLAGMLAGEHVQIINGEFFVGPLPVAPEPEPDQEQIDQQRRMEIISELSMIDSASARPLRAILVGSATDEDRERLASLDEQALELRAELAELDRQDE